MNEMKITTEETVEEVQPQDLHDATLDELDGLDMGAFAQEAQPEHECWRIANDECADWAVSKIAEERADLARIKALADDQINRIMEKVQAAEKRFENCTAYLTSKLAEYFWTVPHKKTKTTESYRLLSGTLKVKLGGVSMKKDDEKLLQYLKASGLNDYIQTAEKACWGDFKKRLQIIGGTVVDGTTGDIVEGVEVIENPDVFSVDV